MPITIPRSIPTTLRRFSACAHVQKPNRRTKRLLDEKERIEHDARSGKFFWRFVASRWSNGVGHFHIDVVHESEIPSDYKPKSKWSVAIKALDEFFGQEVSVAVRTKFIIPLSKLPESGIVRSLQGVSAFVGGVESTMTGARLALPEEPFTSLSWDTDSGKEASIRLAFSKEDIICDQFIEELMKLAQFGLKKFVFEQGEEVIDE